MIRGILFDLDGTLVDSYHPITESLNKARNHFGMEELTVDHVRKIVGRGLEDLIAENIGAGNVKEGVRIFREHYATVFEAKTNALRYVPETLKQLGRMDIKMAVTSNKPSLFSKGILEKLKLCSHFLSVLGPMDVPNPKPYPDMVFKAIEEIGLSINEVVYVGDMVIDIQTCRNAGIPSWVIASGSQTEEELRAGSPDVILENFLQIPDLVRKSIC